MSDKAPLIFLPGTLCDERVWLPVWRQLDRPYSYVPLQWADSLEQMLMLTDDRVKAAQGPVHLIGFSMGGYVAAQYAHQHPDALAGMSLLAYSPLGLGDDEQQQRQQIIRAIEQQRYQGMTMKRARQFVAATHPHVDRLCSEVQTMSNDLGGQVLKGHITATTPREDMTQAVRTLPCPSQMILGDADQMVDADAVSQAVKGASQWRVQRLTNSGHMLPLEQPERIAQLLNALC